MCFLNFILNFLLLMFSIIFSWICLVFLIIKKHYKLESHVFVIVWYFIKLFIIFLIYYNMLIILYYLLKNAKYCKNCHPLNLIFCREIRKIVYIKIVLMYLFIHCLLDPGGPGDQPCNTPTGSRCLFIQLCGLDFWYGDRWSHLRFVCAWNIDLLFY